MPITLFCQNDINPQLCWFNPPSQWRVDTAERCLVVDPDAPTDYWQRTHYGFQVDTGHFLYVAVGGDFVMTARVMFAPVHQYDQAGLMVRLSERCWLKTSVEFEPDGPCRLGAVVTNGGYSDWSTQSFPPDRREVSLRIRREGTDYIVEYLEDRATGERAWTQLRMAHLHDEAPGHPVMAGLYTCSPKGAGMRARFYDFSIA